MAKKYIDAERLKKEVKRLEKAAHKAALGCADRETRKFHEGKDAAYQFVGILIFSLQQEQPDFPTTDEQVKEFLATHPKIKVPEKYKNPDWLLKKLEQPEVDLEEKFNDFLDNVEGVPRMWHSDEQIEWGKDIARHFYELGLNARKEDDK